MAKRWTAWVSVQVRGTSPAGHWMDEVFVGEFADENEARVRARERANVLAGNNRYVTGHIPVPFVRYDWYPPRDRAHAAGYADGEETAESFVARVLDATGVALDAIPDGTADDMLDGHIFARRGATVVVSRGYPDTDPQTGAETYHEFRVIGRASDLPQHSRNTP